MTKIKLKWLISVVVLVSFAGCSVWGEKVETEVKAASARGELCAAELGAPFSYRKKVAVLAADVRNLQDATDLASLDVAWSEALQQRFSDSGRLLVVNASDQHLYTGERQREWIIALAKRLDVQFVVVTRFNNLHVTRSQLGSGEYAIKWPWAQRQIDAELLIFDGYSGAQMAKFSHSANAKGMEQDVVNLGHQPVLQGGFLTSALGKAMTFVLAAQVEAGVVQLACLPLVASVAKITGGDIHIKMPGAVRVHPGDSLQLFRRSGEVDAHLGSVEIVRVFPGSVVAVYRGEGEAPRFSPGMFVRAW